jgi:hypothetical protein
MSYINIIPLQDARVYLRIDDTLTQDNEAITRMINASLAKIEQMTNVHLIAKSKEYIFDDLKATVYDFPINSLTSPTTATKVEKTQYSVYTAALKTDLKLVLNVGYANVSDVPKDLIEVAYEMIDIMYYNKENKLSNLSQATLDAYRRFI